MATIVSTRILRLQAISPRLQAATLQSNIFADTTNIVNRAVTKTISDQSALGTSYPLWGGYVGSVGTPGFNADTYCGAAAVLASADTANDLRIAWGANFGNTVGGASNQSVKNDVIQFAAANSADLGNMTVTVVTDGGYQCLRFDYGAALPAAASGTSAADAMLLVPGQPYMYVRRIDGAGGYIYASPNPTAATNCAYLVGNVAGTFPATCATKFYGAPGLGSSMLSFGIPRTVTVPATTGYASVSRSHYSNSVFSTSVLLPVSCTSWPSAVGAGSLIVYDTTIDVNVYKR